MFLINKINMTLPSDPSKEILPLICNTAGYSAFSSNPAFLTDGKSPSALLPAPSLQPGSHHLSHFKGRADVAGIFLV